MTRAAARSVAQADSPHRLVMASAGTGKTFRLTSEYLRLALREIGAGSGGGALSSILATTFTRNAAGEILERVLDRVSAGVVDATKLRELDEQIGPGLTRDRCRRLLATLVEGLDRLSVETIDAYFMRMARLFALELGIPPGWRIATDQEDQDLREEALDRVLEREDRAELLARAEMLMRGELGRSVRRAVLDAVNGVYGAYLASGGREDVWRVIGPTEPPMDGARLAAALDVLARVPMPRTAKGEPNSQWTKAHQKAVDAARRGDWDTFLEGGLGEKLFNGESKYCRVELPPAVREAYEPLLQHARMVLLARLRDQNLAVHHFAARFDRAYRELKSQRGLYRFEDVPRILLEAKLEQKLQDVYFRMDATIRHVLLDEFQDTSLTQFRLVMPLLDELLSTDDGRSVCCVGDVKQSLYGWRGAEPGLMPAMPGRWGSLVPEPLSKSYRSSQVIMDAVNTVFLRLGDNAALGAHAEVSREWGEAFQKHTAAKKLAGAARLVVAPKDAAGEPEPLAYAARRVKEILDAAPGCTVGVLVRTNKHIPRIIFELKRLGIQASEEGGSPLLDSAPVAVAVSLLQLADFPGDTAAAYHIATSPLGPLVGLKAPVNAAAAQHVSAGLRRRLLAEGYTGVLRWVLRRCAPQMDERGAARFNQLLDLAQAFEERAGTRPSELVRLAREARVEDPSRSRVRVMSIHRSKGLEFDAVVLPDLDKKWAINTNDFLIDRDGPFGEVTVATKYPGEPLRAMHPGLEAIYRRSLDRVVREELCCLYVAMTRAVHELEMIVLPTDKEEVPLSAAGVLRAALAPGEPVAAGEELWRSSKFEVWTSERAARAAAPGEARPIPLALTPGSGSFVPRRAHASPSSLELGARRVDGLFSVRGGRARDEGTLLHAWLELVEWLDDGEPAENDLLDAAADLEWDRDAARALIPDLRRALSGDAAAALRRSRYEERPRTDTIEVRREFAFEVVLPAAAGHEEMNLVGCIDRLVIGRSGGKPVWAEIVDFKSDRVDAADPDEIAASVENYRPQMDAYVRAVRRMFSLQARDVTAALVYVRGGVVRPVECAAQ